MRGKMDGAVRPLELAQLPPVQLRALQIELQKLPEAFVQEQRAG